MSSCPVQLFCTAVLSCYTIQLFRSVQLSFPAVLSSCPFLSSSVQLSFPEQFCPAVLSAGLISCSILNNFVQLACPAVLSSSPFQQLPECPTVLSICPDQLFCLAVLLSSRCCTYNIIVPEEGILSIRALKNPSIVLF